MDVYLGTIQAFAFNFVPHGWAACNGQLLAVSSYQALFALLGTQFGGDGVHNFALPNLQSRVPLGAGTGVGLPTYTVGETGGSATIALTVNNLPAHVHSVAQPVNASAATGASPVNAVPAVVKTTVTDGGRDEVVAVNTSAASGSGQTALPFNSGSAGGGQPVNTQNPYQAVNYCIAVTGIFPTRQ